MPTASGPGADIHYEEQGGRDDAAVLLIPGIGLTTTSWADVSARLVAAGYRVVALDPRGSGRSDKPPGPYTGETMASDVVAVLDAAGVERAHVVGLSMGGMIAQELAIRHPARLRRLVLTSTYARADAWSRRFFELRRAVIQALGLEAGFRLSSLFVFSPQAFRERGDFIASREADQAQVHESAFLAQIDLCLAHDTEARLGEIQADTLVICGEADMLTPAILSRELAAGIDGAALELVPGGSHGMVWDSADEYVDRILAFLARPAETVAAA